MRVFRVSDLLTKNKDIDRTCILAWNGMLRNIHMPDNIAEFIAENWIEVYGSNTGSGSIYDTPDKTWECTPTGSMRAADHWNWDDKRAPGGIACPTLTIIPENSWAVGKWNGYEYEILTYGPKPGPAFRKNTNQLTRELSIEIFEYRILEDLHKRTDQKLQARKRDAQIRKIWQAAEFWDYAEFEKAYYETNRLYDLSRKQGRKMCRPYSSIG